MGVNMEAASHSSFNIIYNSINNNGLVQSRLHDFIVRTNKNQSPDKTVTLGEMDSYIRQGEELAKRISASPTGLLAPEFYTKKNAAHLVWFIMAMNAHFEDVPENGTFRIMDPDQKLFNFLNACKDNNNNGSYGRISSHYNDKNIFARLLSNDKQRGMDMRECKLPNGKGALLFSMLPDNTMFFKLERKGFPPFWKSLKNFQEAAGHSLNYLEHLFLKKGGQSRSENDLTDKKLFIKAVKSLGDENDPKVAKACKEGISQMIAVLEELKKREEAINKDDRPSHHLMTYDPNDPSYKNYVPKDTKDLEAAILKFEKMVDLDKQKGYEGGRQGNEVTLPSFDVFLKNHLFR